MATSSVQFFFGFLFVSIISWMIIVFCSRLFSWLLGESVGFRIGGLLCLHDVEVKFKKGAIESMSVGEMKLSLRQFFIKLRDRKMQLLISDLEVLMRSTTSTTNLQNSETEIQKSDTWSRGKWIVVVNIARFLSVSVSDLVVKTAMGTVEVEELKLDINKDGGTNPNLYVKVHVQSILFESSIISDQSCNLSFKRCPTSQVSSASSDKSPATLFCNDLSISSEFGHDRAVGIAIRDVVIISGDVNLDLEDNSFPKSKQSPAASSIQDEVGTLTTNASSAKKPLEEQQLLTELSKYTPYFPGKVSFSLRKLDVLYRENGLLAENNVNGVLFSVTSKSVEDRAESTHLDVEIRLCEIHLFKKAESSILEITEVNMESFIQIPVQLNLPIRADIDIKVGGTGCNLFMYSLEPWLRLRRGTHTLQKPKATDTETIFMWRVTSSAPEMNVILYGVDDLPLYHFTSQPTLLSANNISSEDRNIQVELGELNLHLADESYTVSIPSYASGECRRRKYLVSLKLSQFGFCLKSDSHSILVALKRAKLIYQEYMEEHIPCSNITLFDMHDMKFERHIGKTQDCSLFTATAISLGWEPDVHLSLYEMFLRFTSVVYAQRLKEDESDWNKDISYVEDSDNQNQKESSFAIDVEIMTMSGKVKDDVEVKMEVKSIFSENVSVGVLFEGSMVAVNDSQVFKSKRMQISRTPTASDAVSWVWIVQGLDVHICMPYKLQLRLIIDLIEEMLEGLRLITIEIKENIFPEKEESSNHKEIRSELGVIRFCMRKVTAYIEEEPMQGWLDEHYQLMKKEACELAVRLKFFEDVIHKETIDHLDINKVKKEIHERSFQSYYRACQGLVPSESLGAACRKGFQAGFNPSVARTSLLSVCATDFDLSLKMVRGDDAGLMGVLKKLDPICQEIDMNFFQLNGSNVCLNTGSFIVQLRNYTLPLLSGTYGKCEGLIVQLRAQQTDEGKSRCSVPPQISQNVSIGRWRKLEMFRLASDTTPRMKTYTDLRIQFEKGEASFGVGYEPAFSDISYAFSVALGAPQDAEEEQSFPWWDNIRNNVHGNITLSFSESKWTVLATTDPYETLDKLQIVTGYIEIQQSNGRVSVNAEDFKVKLSSLESMISRHSLEVLVNTSGAALLEAPLFNLEVTMDWDFDSGNSVNFFHPLRSTSLSLGWNLSLRSKTFHQSSSIEPESIASAAPKMNFGAHDLAWILNFCRMNCDPPNMLRSFSRWPRYGVPRIAISESLSLDQVMTEFMLRVNVTPYLIKYMHWNRDDTAKGLTFDMTKLKYELSFSRSKHKYTSECKRDALNLVYQGLDLHFLKAFIKKDVRSCVPESVQHQDEGFLLSSDYITIRRQAPEADNEKLFVWQEAGRRNLEMKYDRSEFENGSENEEHIGSDYSDDDGYNVVIPDNCQRIFVYGLKLLWTIEHRDVVRSFVGGISKAFEPPKPSPSRQYTQKKILEEHQKESFPETHQGEILRSTQPAETSYNRVVEAETSESEEEETQQFMVNVIQPQFNLHSEEVNGRFLLSANSGRVIARSFHSVMHVGLDVIEQVLGTRRVQIPECSSKMTWTRMEFSVMLENAQAHVAATDVNPGAGLQWLPKIPRNSTRAKRTGALLESVFMPCDMYLRYTRHKGGTPDLKVKPLKELTFNSCNITATMTSRQFHVLMDVLVNLLFARLPKPRKSSLQCPSEEDIEEEAAEVVPYGVEEVELAKINLEEKDRERKLLLDDIRNLGSCSDNMKDTSMEKEGDLWMISTRRSVLVQGLKKELLHTQNSRKAASTSVRMSLQKAAQLQLMEKEKNKSPPYAMSISLQINKLVWSMLANGKSFVEAEINDMIYDFDRDYKDIGITRFTTKHFVVRNCLPNAKSDMLLSAWNPPPIWGKEFMLCVKSKQGAPKDGYSPFELFNVEVYPLKIDLTETLYTMMWEYFFPEEEQILPKPQEVWKVKDSKSSRVTSVSTSAKASGSAQELSKLSFDKTWEEEVAESVANELLLQPHCSIKKQEHSSTQKFKATTHVKSRRSSHEEKMIKKSQEKKKSKPKKMMEFQNIKISQVELLITYEGSRLIVSDLELLMDTFKRAKFTGTWGGLFVRVKKHIIWGVLKSVTGFQMKKFKYVQKKKLKNKPQNNPESTNSDLSLSEDDQTEKHDQDPVTWFNRQRDGAGARFVTSIRGLFHTQRREAKRFVLRTMRDSAENDSKGEWSDSDVEPSPFRSHLTITKAKRLIRRHTKGFRRRSQRCSFSQQRESFPLSTRETTAYENSDASGSSSYEES